MTIIILSYLIEPSQLGWKGWVNIRFMVVQSQKEIILDSMMFSVSFHMTGNGRIAISAKKLGFWGHRVVAGRLWTLLEAAGMFGLCRCYFSAQRGSERYVVPPTLLCRWNTPLSLGDGEDHGES